MSPAAPMTRQQQSLLAAVLPVIIHFLIVLIVVAAAVIITLTQHGELPTSVGGLLGAALGISASNVSRGNGT